jgi:hypothetical protein
MHDLRQALLEAVSPDDVRSVAGKLLELARAGDVPAAKIWLDYVIGRPAQAVELSGPGGAALDLDLGRLTGEVLAALAGYPEARIVVAARLRSLAGSGVVDEPGGTTP